MYSKSVVYRFTSFTSAKIAAGLCTENLSKFVVKLDMSSLTITVSKEMWSIYPRPLKIWGT